MNANASLSFVLSAGVFLSSIGCGAIIEPDGEPILADRSPAPIRSSISTQEFNASRGYAVELLMTMTDSQQPEIRANAIEALSAEPTRLEPVVAIALDDPNEGVRSVAAMVAGRSSLESLTPTIRQLRHDPSPYVRASSIYAMARMGEHIDPSELASILFEGENTRIRAHAAYILGELGDESAIPMLKQAYLTPVRQAQAIELKLLRLQIAEALYKLGDESSIDSIRAALYPSRPEELEATALAVQIIGEIRDRGSIDQLIYLVNGASEQSMPAEVRLAIASSLASMGLNEGGYVADEYADNAQPVIRAQAASVYGKTGQMQNLEKLNDLMRDPSVLTRVSAAGAVLDLGDSSERRSSARPR
jgi:HEAT repeat protein